MTPPDYVAYTMFGAVLIAFPDDGPTEYHGGETAIAFLHDKITRTVGLNGGATMTVDGLSPDELLMCHNPDEYIRIESFNPAPAEGTP